MPIPVLRGIRYGLDTHQQARNAIVVRLLEMAELIQELELAYACTSMESMCRVVWIATLCKSKVHMEMIRIMCNNITDIGFPFVKTDFDFFSTYLSRIATYYPARGTFHTLGPKFNLFTGKRVVITAIDSLQQETTVDPSSSQVSTFDVFKSALLSADDLAKFHGRHSKRLENEYTRRRENLEIREHCEMRLLCFHEENPDMKPLQNYLGISEHSCFNCDFVLRLLQDDGYLCPFVVSQPGRKKRQKPASPAVYNVVPGYHTRKVSADWKFPAIDYGNAKGAVANNARLRRIEAQARLPTALVGVGV